MPLQARRVFRIALAMALALAIAYGSGAPLAYLAPLLVLILGAAPAPPPGFKGLLGLIVVVLGTLGIGLLLIPLLNNAPFSALLLVAAGLWGSTYLSVARGKALVGTLLGVGFTLIPAAGLVEFALALAVMHALVFAVGLAVVCLWIVYPWLPEEAGAVSAAPAPIAPAAANWIALRTALIVMPPFLLALANPAAYLPLIMKSIVLAQQGSAVDARSAGRELLGSTFLGGCLAILFWYALGLAPNLWMFTGWMLLFGLFCAGKLYGVIATRLPPSFWQNVCATLLILIGPAVEDAAAGKDVQEAFVTRMGLFIAVTLYAWMTIRVLEQWRARRRAAEGWRPTAP